ncbi:hypothetical protein K1719_047572 [Acacia pycnantha]|nr:hypothetical protein K1719_047572 [Acacia pycnantha]
MPHCLSFRSLTSSSASASGPNPPAPPQGYSTEHTTVTSTQSSPAPNVSREFNRIMLRNSYKEIRSIIELEVFDPPDGNDPLQDQPQLADGCAAGDSQRRFLEKLLQPDRDSVQKALPQLKSDSLTHLISTYFDHSEAAFELCLRLLPCLRYASIMYAPLRDLLDDLPFDSNHLTQSQCDRAFDIFSVFDAQGNPFLLPIPLTSATWAAPFMNLTKNFVHIFKSLAPNYAFSVGPLLVLLFASLPPPLEWLQLPLSSTHALVAIAAAPVCPVLSHFKNPKKKELARLAQLEAASRVTFALKQHLDSIDRLVDQLHGAVKADKNSVRLGLEMGKNRYAIQEIVKLLRKRYESFRLLMEELETNVYISLNFVNRARSNLLRQICLHQNA